MDDAIAGADAPMTRLTLDLRGTRFTIEQDMLMNLPESVLLCLFPNGLVLSRQAAGAASGAASTSGAGTTAGDQSELGLDAAEEEEEVYMVDVRIRSGIRSR